MASQAEGDLAATAAQPAYVDAAASWPVLHDAAGDYTLAWPDSAVKNVRVYFGGAGELTLPTPVSLGLDYDESVLVYLTANGNVSLTNGAGASIIDTCPSVDVSGQGYGIAAEDATTWRVVSCPGQGGGTSGTVAWGDIEGAIIAQADLFNALSSKYEEGDDAVLGFLEVSGIDNSGTCRGPGCWRGVVASASIAATLGDGEFAKVAGVDSIAFRSGSVLGNIAYDVRAGAVDVTPPVISGFSGAQVGADAVLSFDTDEPLALVRINVSTASLITARTLTESDCTPLSGTVACTDPAPTPDTYTYTLTRAEDAAGNDGAGDETDDVTVAPSGTFATLFFEDTFTEATTVSLDLHTPDTAPGGAGAYVVYRGVVQANLSGYLDTPSGPSGAGNVAGIDLATLPANWTLSAKLRSGDCAYGHLRRHVRRANHLGGYRDGRLLHPHRGYRGRHRHHGWRHHARHAHLRLPHQHVLPRHPHLRGRHADRRVLRLRWDDGALHGIDERARCCSRRRPDLQRTCCRHPYRRRDDLCGVTLCAPSFSSSSSRRRRRTRSGASPCGAGVRPSARRRRRPIRRPPLASYGAIAADFAAGTYAVASIEDSLIAPDGIKVSVRDASITRRGTSGSSL